MSDRGLVTGEQVPTDIANWAPVLEFWHTAGPERWFDQDPVFDRQFRASFMEAHLAAARRELDDWLQAPRSGLALLILLDQFPRNAFRGTSHMYATDALARYFAQRMVDAGFDMQIEAGLRVFCYLPFSHSEDIEDQRLSLGLHEQLGEPWLHHAREHLQIIERFGRFPHRNPFFGRVTTTAEQLYLDQGGFAG